MPAPTGAPGLLPSPVTSLIRPMFRSLAISASGLTAQRARLEAAASNIANAETTRGADGRPYQRLVVQMAERAVEPPPPGGLFPAGAAPGDLRAVANFPAMAIASTDPVNAANGVEVTTFARDVSEGPLVYDPGHPDANASGYVRMPNVRVPEEMAEIMDAKRLYEANASVFSTVKAMLRRALEI